MFSFHLSQNGFISFSFMEDIFARIVYWLDSCFLLFPFFFIYTLSLSLPPAPCLSPFHPFYLYLSLSLISPPFLFLLLFLFYPVGLWAYFSSLNFWCLYSDFFPSNINCLLIYFHILFFALSCYSRTFNIFLHITKGLFINF